MRCLILVILPSALGLRLPQEEGSGTSLKLGAHSAKKALEQKQTAVPMKSMLDDGSGEDNPKRDYLRRDHPRHYPPIMTRRFDPLNDAIREAFSRGKPFLVGRISCGAEADIMRLAAEGRRIVPKKSYHNNAGIYPLNDQGMRDFVEIFSDALRSVGPHDLMAGTCNHEYDRLVINTFCSGHQYNASYRLEGMESFLWANPWTSALKGKTVLIIHAFIDSIKCQMKRREKLFKDPNVLPDMKLKYIKTVQSNMMTTPHASWKASLQNMTDQIDNIGHFDVAIISGGAFGMPLAAYVKEKANASAIMLGGVTQLLFGLKGNRWTAPPRKVSGDGSETIAYHDYFSEEWMYPLLSDTPANYKAVENGCYWGPNKKQLLKQCPV